MLLWLIWPRLAISAIPGRVRFITPVIQLHSLAFAPALPSRRAVGVGQHRSAGFGLARRGITQCCFPRRIASALFPLPLFLPFHSSNSTATHFHHSACISPFPHSSRHRLAQAPPAGAFPLHLFPCRRSAARPGLFLAFPPFSAFPLLVSRFPLQLILSLLHHSTHIQFRFALGSFRAGYDAFACSQFRQFARALRMILFADLQATA